LQFPGGANMKKFAWLAIITLALTLTITIVTTQPITRYQAHRAASTYYKHLSTGDFEEAFQYLAYYDQYSDRPPEVSSEDAKKIWVSRAEEVRTAGLYVVEAESIQICTDDGYPMGKAQVTIVDHGIERSVIQDVHFARLSGAWKVQAVRTSHDGASISIAVLDEALSGHIPQVSE